MKSTALRYGIVLPVGFLWITGSHSAPARAVDYYAAIAYSESTHTWGYAVGRTSLNEAQTMAIINSGVRDAKLVAWAKNSWCALARERSGSAYGGGTGMTDYAARAQAVEVCQKRATHSQQCEIVLSIPAFLPQLGPDPSRVARPTNANPAPIMEYRPNPMFMPVFGRTYSNQPGYWSSKRNPNYNPGWGRTYSNQP